MISENVENLVFAGRNISVTHAALSSSRVMATCGILGQAIGTAVALAVKEGKTIDAIDIKGLQQVLMDDDCFIPWHKREISELSKNAECSAEVVRNGYDRGEENLWICKAGDVIEYRFEKDTEISSVRLVFDNDMNRDYHNMPCNYPLVQTKFKLPKTLISEYRIEGESESGERFTLHCKENRKRFVRHALSWKVKTLRLVPLATHGSEDFRVFAFEAK